MTKHNIIIFGESGSGKSSIVNMIVGQTVARVSNSPVGCTFKHDHYAAPIGGTHFNIYDTVGLNEGEQGRVPHWQAIHQLYTLIRRLEGVSLLIYCMRGRIKENARANWVLFHKVLCAEKVPIIAVETGLEGVADLVERRVVLTKALEAYKMVPKDVACIVSIQGKANEHKERYSSSRDRLRLLIIEWCRKEVWCTTTDNWIDQIYKTTYSTKLCLFSQVDRVDFTNGVVDKFLSETEMTTDEADRLKSTLLDAETKLRRKGFLKWY